MLYAVTIFLSSFLLFLVQPLIARLILPWFGGSAAVWTTCMLFFQALLLAGYGYAHFSNRFLAGRRQAIVHIALLVLAVATLPISPGESWKPEGTEEPIFYIVRLLCVAVGLPYFLLAANSPLLQAWFARAKPDANPYRLFALSNVASLAALVGYPFVVEPFFSASEQVAGWSWMFAAFALMCALVAWRTPARESAVTEEQAGRIEKSRVLLWIALSATGSVLLLAVTNHLTQNVASVPLLWLAPLTIYLLSFIVTFEGRNWYQPRFAWTFVLVWLGGMAWLVADNDLHHDLALNLGVFLSGLLVGCVFCHGELYRLRPAPRQLTAFYLTVSAGGALGGVLVAIVAPLVFNGYYELGVALVALAILGAVRFALVNPVARYASLAAVLAVAGTATYDALRFQEDVRVSTRSFYGVLRVKEYGTPGDESHVRRLMHGTIMHGEQYLHPAFRDRPTSYYTAPSGVGLAIESRRQAGPVKVGVVGLGAGTVAAWSRAGDTYRFYEIDRHVIDVAQSQFGYLGDSKARIDLVLGDARLNLEREAPQGYDVLAIDAFSGDAIPVHLITREALGVYLRHLKPDGIVAFHVSNRFLDLIPIVARIAAEHGAHATLIRDEPDSEDEDRSRSRSDWVLVSRSEKALDAPEIEAAGIEAEDRPGLRTWTDEYSNLIQILQ
jgi:MFS family permease/SAM-dependent methyltransferase